MKAMNAMTIQAKKIQTMKITSPGSADVAPSSVPAPSFIRLRHNLQMANEGDENEGNANYGNDNPSVKIQAMENIQITSSASSRGASPWLALSALSFRTQCLS